MTEKEIFEYLEKKYPEQEHLFDDFINSYIDEDELSDLNEETVERYFNEFIDNCDNTDFLGEDYDWDSGNEDHL